MSKQAYWARLILYALIASVTALITDLQRLADGESIASLEGAIIGLKAILAAAIAVRAFVDQSPNIRETTKQQEES